MSVRYGAVFPTMRIERVADTTGADGNKALTFTPPFDAVPMQVSVGRPGAAGPTDVLFSVSNLTANGCTVHTRRQAAALSLSVVNLSLAAAASIPFEAVFAL